MEHEVQSFYGNRLRLRACGICIQDDSLLMINHRGISKGDFWAPPGGGIHFGERAADCLVREFKEETNLSVEVKNFLFACEFINPPLHAVELFFEVSSNDQELLIGSDTEPGSPSIIKDAKFMNWWEIEKLTPEERHGIFNHLDHPSRITALRGYFKV